MTDKLTGRQRYRSRKIWGREVLILQVEQHASYYDPNFCEIEHYTFWRDAKTTDLLSPEGGIIHGCSIE